MKIKGILITGILFISTLAVKSQVYSDMLRFSQNNYSMTARSIGMGSAMGAVGADFSSTIINPAGLGVYRNSEFFGSFQIARLTSTTDFRGQESNDDKYNINIPSVGLVIAGLGYDKGKVKRDGWVAVNFGLGFTRTNNFHSNYTIESKNNGTSIVESWRQEANGQDSNKLFTDFSAAGLAYQSSLIKPEGKGSINYTSALKDEITNFTKYQLDENAITGSTNNLNFTLGGNYSNKIFVGVGVEIPIIGYESNRTFTETNAQRADSQKVYLGSKFTQKISTSGAGFGLSLGGIYKPNDNFRFGTSVKIPTFLWLTDNYNYSMTSEIKGYLPYQVESPDGQFSYKMTLPFKATLSAAYIFGKSGLISFDYDYIDYTMGRLSSSEFNFRNENKNATYYLKSGNNFRLGGELRSDYWAFRGGLQYMSAPYQSKFVLSGFDGSGLTYSFGLGYRDDKFFADLGWQKSIYSNTYNPFLLKSGTVDQTATLVQRNTNFTFTIGTRF